MADETIAELARVIAARSQALANLLIAKGILTQEEWDDELRRLDAID